MKKLVGFFIIATVLNGCAQHKLESIYQTEGIEITVNTKGADTLNKYALKRAVKIDRTPLAVCIAQELSNSPILLSTETQMDWYGIYGPRGNRWRRPISNSQRLTIGGGDTIQLIKDNYVIANAITNYRYGTKYFVSYTLTAIYKQMRVDYLFSNIKQIQQNLSLAFNNGFEDVTTFEGDYPDLVIRSLNSEVDKIQSCLLRQ